MRGYLIVFLGAGLGGGFRHAINLLAARLLGTGFPWGTFAINVAGSLAMGLIAAWFAFRGEASGAWRLFLATGVLGGFTTFSAYSLEIGLLWERGELGLAAAYALGSVVLAVGAMFLGLWIGRAGFA